MDFSKIKNKLLILLCAFVVIFPFFCVAGLCTENTVETTHISGVIATPDSNIFTVSNNTIGVDYFYAEKGKKYTITLLQDVNVERIIVSSSSVPKLNDIYEILYSNLHYAGDIFVFSPPEDTYISISTSLPENYFSITYDYLNGQSNAVSGLVENVGISSIWNIFDISINYIVVVVLFAFGIYIIFRIITKISKGKEGL